MRDGPDEMNRKGIIFGRHAPEKRGAAWRMRRQMTPSEALLWERMRANRLDGLQFRRQQVIDGLIVDFYCHAAGLVVECDGPIHETQQEHDEDQDAILQRRGLLVLRFSNEQIETETERVLSAVLNAARERIWLISSQDD